MRYDAAYALGVLGDARAVVPLIALMQQYDEKHSVDSAAAMGLESLGGIGDPHAVESLAEIGDATEKARAEAGITWRENTDDD